jgi:CRISPR system Cascade subunit CasE
MYLSSLMIDTGGNPDRPRPGRLWLRNIYHVHQRLSMAFPAKERASDPCPFLFRIDNRIDENAARAVILVQSAVEPDWEKAFENVSSVFWVVAPLVREYAPSFAAGDRLRFRVRMNLSKKAKTARDGMDLRKTREEVDGVRGLAKSQSKRVSVTWNGDEGETPDDAIRKWFSEKGKRGGFALDGDFEVVHLGWVVGCKPGRAEKDGLRFRSALLEGSLSVTDETLFRQSLSAGLGSAKGFGFGLLSVVRAGGTAAPQSAGGTPALRSAGGTPALRSAGGTPALRSR